MSLRSGGLARLCAIKSGHVGARLRERVEKVAETWFLGQFFSIALGGAFRITATTYPSLPFLTCLSRLKKILKSLVWLLGAPKRNKNRSKLLKINCWCYDFMIFFWNFEFPLRYNSKFHFFLVALVSGISALFNSRQHALTHLELESVPSFGHIGSLVYGFFPGKSSQSEMNKYAGNLKIAKVNKTNKTNKRLILLTKSSWRKAGLRERRSRGDSCRKVLLFWRKNVKKTFSLAFFKKILFQNISWYTDIFASCPSMPLITVPVLFVSAVAGKATQADVISASVKKFSNS